MREIQCKAKVKDWKEKPTDEQWVYGYYVQGLNMYEEPIHIIFNPTTMFFSHGETDGWEEIDPDTLCQYTGLTDKNGNKIWENDICSTDLARRYLIVEFRNGGFMYNCNDGDKDYYDIMLPIEPLEQQDKYTEVIGNTFDNPKLLKGGAE